MLNTIKEKLSTVLYKTVIITLVLGFLIQTIAAFPLYAFAVDEDEIEHVDLNNTNEIDEDNIRLLYEIENYRTEYSKVFMRTDGKLEYAYYDELVNYFDGDKYQEVDARFKEEANDYNSAINKYNVKLPKKISDNKKIKLLFADSSIELIYNGINKSSATLLENNDSDGNISNLKNVKGQVLYKNIFNNVDLKIESTGSYFKENIIVNKYIKNFSFEYTLKLKKLTLIEDNNTIKFVDQNNKVVYEIEPYFMIDTNSKVSYEVNLKYELIKEDEYKFTVIPEDEFMKNATYPVVIDPVLEYTSNSTSNSIIRTKSVMKNSYNSVTSNIQITKYEIESEYYTSNDGYYGIMQVDLSDFTDVYDINQATIFLRGHSSNYTNPVVVREIWNPSSGQLVFDEINGYSEYKYKTSALSFKHYSGNYYGLDITRYFNETYARKKLFFEFSPELFEYNEESQYYNSNMSSSYKPYLQIILSENEGLSPYRSYETVSFGDVGNYYVDLIHGNGTFETSIYSDNYLPFNYFYSSVSKNINYGYGNGFRLSVNEKIDEIIYNNKTYLCLTDATGYKEYFYYNEDNDNYMSAEGSGATIKMVLPDEYSYTSKEISKLYNANGDLIYIKYFNDLHTSNDDIIIDIEYNNQNLISSIRQDSYQISFVYKDIDSTYMLTKATIDIVDNSMISNYQKLGIVKSFRLLYDDNNNLIEIRRFNGDLDEDIQHIMDLEKTSEEEKNIKIDTHLKGFIEKRVIFDYDKNNYLYRALSNSLITNYEDEITNYEGMQVVYIDGKITKYEVKLKNIIDYKVLMYFNYGNNYTVLEDYKGYNKTYVHDYFENTACIYDDSGYVVNYQYGDFSSELPKEQPNYLLKHQIKYISDSLNVINNPILNCSFEEVTQNDIIPNWVETINDNTIGNVVSNVGAPYGNCALEVSKSNIESNYYEVYQEVSLAPGDYTLSAFVKLNKNLYNIYSNYVGYIKIDAEYGQILQIEPCEFNNKNFEMVTSEFSVPGPMKVKIICGIKSNSNDYQLTALDKAYFDNIQINKSDLTNSFNIIPNHSFETNSNWNTVNCTFIERPNISSIDDINLMFGLTNLAVPYNGVATQDFYYSSKSGDKFNLGGFINYSIACGDIRLSVRFYDSFSSNSSPYYTLKFNKCSKIYVYASANLIVDDGSDIINQYNKIEIKIENLESPSGIIDNIHLYNFHAGTKYDYDDEGNLINVENEEDKITFEYNTNGEVTSIITNKYDYNITRYSEFDNNVTQKETIYHKIEKLNQNIYETTIERVLNFYTVNSEDLVVNDEISNYYAVVKTIYDENNQGTTCSSIYDVKTNALTATIDEFGIKTIYKYDSLNRINKILDSVYESEQFDYNDQNKVTKRIIGKYAYDIENNYEFVETTYNSVQYNYDDNGNISKVIINNNDLNSYSFDYDEYHYIINVYCANNLLKHYDYYYINGINTGFILKEINSKGEFIRYEYSENFDVISCYHGIIVNEKISEEEKINTTTYDIFGRLIYYTDYLEDKSYYYNYDINNNLIKINISNANSLNSEYNDSISFVYNDENVLLSTTYNFNNQSMTIDFDYVDDNYELNYTKINDTIFTNPTEVVSGSTKYFESIIKTVNNTTIINEKMYLDNDGNFMLKQEENAGPLGKDKVAIDTALFTMSSRIKKQEIITYEKVITYEYSYDNNNNVKKILFSDSENLLNNRTYCYTYEFKNLIKEEVYIGLLNYDTQSNNLTKILLTNYTYDNYGNITSINRKIKTNEYSYLPSEIIYTYSTSNVYLLTSYSVDDISYQFNYDLEGNLLNFKDLTLSYKYGKLVNIESINSNLQISYEYNSKGIRTKKVVNNLIYEYTTFNDLILSEKISKKNSDNSIDQLNVINYLYDSNNSAIGFKLGDDSYYYVKNLIGEIIYIVDENSNIVGEYKYDAYGNILNLSSLSPIAKLNSIRYKGYYYDVETGLFWLSSRYYSPELCRFISPDDVSYLDPSSINGLNLYAYCANNPVMYVDPSGHEWYNPLTWDWGEIAKGVGLIITGVGAIAVGIVTLPYGGWISAVAGITILAGGGTALFGLSDVGEGITDYNVIQEAVFMGNENAYNITESIFATTATIGSIICGGYIKYNTTTTPRSLPGKGQKPHSGVWNMNDKTLGYYGADGKLRYSIAFNNHNTPSVHRIPHWHTEMPHSEPINSFWRFIVELIKRGF